MPCPPGIPNDMSITYPLMKNKRLNHCRRENSRRDTLHILVFDVFTVLYYLNFCYTHHHIHIIGTFQDDPGKESIDDCLACSPGYYCEHYGRTNVTGQCDGGFYCYSGANNSSPMDGVTGWYGLVY